MAHLCQMRKEAITFKAAPFSFFFKNHPETSGTVFWQENSHRSSITGTQAKVINEHMERGPLCRQHTFRAR